MPYSEQDKHIIRTLKESGTPWKVIRKAVGKDPANLKACSVSFDEPQKRWLSESGSLMVALDWQSRK